ncbi:hypothetical protein [Cyclobacterium qasimii]|nr:hypothetical protein [Cyclobacterium qasimii]
MNFSKWIFVILLCFPNTIRLGYLVVLSNNSLFKVMILLYCNWDASVSIEHLFIENVSIKQTKFNSKIVNFMDTMGKIDIKKELRALIEQENDLHVLEEIKTLLVKSSLNPILREKLTSRALKAEEDIKAGKVYTREEFEKKLDSRLDQ